jgi:integrase
VTRGITTAAIKAAKPGQTLRDSAVPGLQLRIFDSKKAWYMYYRTRDGQQRKPKIGPYPALTIDQARKIARDMMVKVLSGEDPSQQRKDAISSPTFSQAADRYIVTAKLKPGSLKIYQFAIGVLKKEIGRDKVTKIIGRDLERLAVRLTDHYAVNTVNTIIAVAGAVFRDCVREGTISANPAASVSVSGGNSRERYLTAEEYQRLAEALEFYSKTDPSNVAAIRLLAITGARVSEIVKAKRSWVKGEWLELPDSKTGKKKIYLPEQARAIIAAEPSINDSLIGIAGRPQEIWNKIRARAKLDDFKMHDLRHSFASEAISSGMSLEIVGQLLGHKSANTTKRYAHLIDEARIRATTTVAEKVSDRMRL